VDRGGGGPGGREERKKKQWAAEVGERPVRRMGLEVELLCNNGV